MKDNEEFVNSRKNIILENIENIKNLIVNNDTYIDVHCWKFSPWNFKFIIDILYNLKLINLKVIRCYNTIKYHNEFFCIMKKIS